MAAYAEPDERVVRIAGGATSAGAISPFHRDAVASDHVPSPSETVMTISTATDEHKAAAERVSGRQRFKTNATAEESLGGWV